MQAVDRATFEYWDCVSAMLGGRAWTALVLLTSYCNATVLDLTQGLTIPSGWLVRDVVVAYGIWTQPVLLGYHFKPDI